jgi:hypothetical protein
MRRTVIWIVALVLLVIVCVLSGLFLQGYVEKMSSGDAPPISSLKTLATAEARFREDKERGAGRYGTLAQLADAKLVLGPLARGTKHGYLFEAHPSPTTPEFLWFAVARPEKYEPGARLFFTNQAGVIFYTTPSKPEELAVALDAETAAVPTGWIQVGK